MEINIQSIHFKADQKLIDYITKKLHKLSTFHENIIDAQVYLKVEHASDNNNKILEVKLNVYGNAIFVEEHCRTFECAIDLAYEALRQQLVKYKDKLKATSAH